MAELAPGMLVDRHVRLVRQLAKGGMGSVWLAENVNLKNKVAVKFMAADMADRERLRERFQREAQINAAIHSIHVVQVFDQGVMADGTPYIVMELLEGQSVTNRVESEGPLPVRQVGLIVSQVCRALHSAHELDIIHRDIKPDNIYVTDSDYEVFVKVLDFGIARQESLSAERGSVTATGMIVGTPEFMSPEQSVGSKEIDARSDLYSLATVTYYALTGRLPYDPNGAVPLWMQMSARDFVRPSKYVKGLPEGMDAWFEKALEPKPVNRFQNAREMASALGDVLAPQAHELIDELSHIGAPRPAQALGAHITRVRHAGLADDFDGPTTLVIEGAKPPVGGAAAKTPVAESLEDTAARPRPKIPMELKERVRKEPTTDPHRERGETVKLGDAALAEAVVNAAVTDDDRAQRESALDSIPDIMEITAQPVDEAEPSPVPPAVASDEEALAHGAAPAQPLPSVDAHARPGAPAPVPAAPSRPGASAAPMQKVPAFKAPSSYLDTSAARASLTEVDEDLAELDRDRRSARWQAVAALVLIVGVGVLVAMLW